MIGPDDRGKRFHFPFTSRKRGRPTRRDGIAPNGGCPGLARDAVRSALTDDLCDDSARMTASGTLDDWLTVEYRVNPDVARSWVTQEEVLPLLDGRRSCASSGTLTTPMQGSC